MFSFFVQPSLGMETQEKVENLVAKSLKQKVSGIQVVKLLKEECISTDAYNNFIMKLLLDSGNPLAVKLRKTLYIGGFLDKGYVKSLLPGKKNVSAGHGKKTLFEERRVLTEYCNVPRHPSCGLMNRILNTGEILTKFKKCAVELGMNTSIERGCAEYLEKGLKLYIKNLVGDCDGKITVRNLRRGMGKYLRLFNSFDMIHAFHHL